MPLIVNTMRRATLLALFCLVATAASASASQRAYFGGTGGAGARVAGFDLGPGGAIGAPVGIAGAGAGPLGGIAFAPDGTSVYAASAGGVPGFALGPNGALTPSGTAPGGAAFNDVVVSPDGRIAYATEAGTGGGIHLFTRGAGGALAEIPGSPTPYPGAAGLAISPGGRLLFATSVSSGGVRPFSIAVDGTLSTGAEVPAGSAPVAIALNPDGRFLYVSGTQASSAIRTYAIGANGSLSAVGAPVPTGGDGTSDLLVAPNGKHLYAANRDSGSLSSFAIDADGTPIPATAPVALAGEPVSLAADATGTHLYAADAAAEQAFAFALGADGSATPVAGSPFPTGVAGGPGSAALSPDQPPTASFTTAVNNQRVTFDAFGSSDPDGSVARYDWDFGDGSIELNGGPELTQRYKKGHKPPVTLTVTDDAGCSTTFVSDGRTPYCNGSAVARTTITPFQPDVLGNGSQKLTRNVRLKLRCPVDCRVHVIARLKLSGKGARAKKAQVKGARKSFKAGRAKTLKLRMPRRAVKHAADAPRAIARLKITAKDGAGDQFKLRTGIRLR